MHIFLSIFLSVFYAGLTEAQGAWYYPDNGTVPTFNNIDVVNASWSVPATSSASTNLWLWCTPNGTVSYTLEFNVSVPFDGNRLVTLNYGSDLYCHFGIADLPPGNFHIVESDQPPVTWAPLPDPSPTTSNPDAVIISSLGAPAASSAIISSSSSYSTLSLKTAATTAKSLISSDSSLSIATSLMSSRPNLSIAPKSTDINANHPVPTVSSSSLPLTSPQPASEIINSRTLSTGSKAGIIVAIVAVVAISAINILYCIKRLKLRSEPAQVAGDLKAYTQWSSELPGPEFAVEKNGCESARKKEIWELQ